MAASIGIKIANGEFYPLLEENSQIKKRLVLTTVHDRQNSAQIDLYKSEKQTMADAVYIGSMVVENIKPCQKGDPSIEMIIGSSAEGDISAEAVDIDAEGNAEGERQYLSASLTSLDDNTQDFGIPDFELEMDKGPPAGLYEKEDKDGKKKSSGFSMVAAAVAVAALLLLLATGIWYFVFWGKGASDTGGASHVVSIVPVEEETAAPVAVEPPPVKEVPPPIEEAPPAAVEPSPEVKPPAIAEATPIVEAPAVAAPPPIKEAPPPVKEASPPVKESTPPVVQTPPAVQAPPVVQTPPPVIEAPKKAPAPVVVSRKRNPPVASYRVPAVIPKEGVQYRIRWGDTLWDISEAFYRNPWQYPRIARFNNIRNPDRIISGSTIRIPPKN